MISLNAKNAKKKKKKKTFCSVCPILQYCLLFATESLGSSPLVFTHLMSLFSGY